MEIKNIKKIFDKTSDELFALIDNWNREDVKDVLLAYGELKRRGENIPSNLKDALNTFSRINKEKNIDKFLETFIAVNGYNSMEEFYDRVNAKLNTPKKVKAQTIQKEVETSSFSPIKSYLHCIDNGCFFRNTIGGFYVLSAYLSLLNPLYFLYEAITYHVFDLPSEVIILFILEWLILAFGGWISFKILWNRKSKILKITEQRDEFVATPVLSHLIQTLGELSGTYFFIVGFGTSLLSTIFLSGLNSYLPGIIGMGLFGSEHWYYIILIPVYGFLIIVLTRFLAEQLKALAVIANNTKQK